MKYCLRAVLCGVLTCVAAGSAQAQTVLINEFLASNRTGITDPDFGGNGDWIELYNAGSTPVDLTGYYLTDDLDNPAQWQVAGPAVVPAGGFLLLWADGDGNGLHTSFRLSADGEQLGLFDPAGVPVDTLAFGLQETDVSFGRAPDGGSEWRFFAAPTPGEPNETAAFEDLAPPPVFSQPGGLYDSGLDVALYSALEGSVVRYTTDGSPPSGDSPAFEAPLHVDATTVIRAAVFKDGYMPSPVITQTYLVAETSHLPVISLATDPDHFFSDRSGIYVKGTNGVPGYCRTEPHNWNQKWERPIHVEFFEPDGSLGFAMDAGVQISGGCTRIYDQKSLALYARKEYGPAKIKYQVFPDLPTDEFNNLVLRSGGQDWWRSLIRDPMMQAVVRGSMDVDVQAYRPAIVFLNGQYWGIHNIREKLNEHFTETYHGTADVDIVKGNAKASEGSADHYKAMIDFVAGNDLARPEHYQRVQEMMEVDQFIDYMIAEIYTANYDWPGNNTRFWRPQTEDGRWRWMLFDVDLGLGAHGRGRYDTNTIAVVTDPAGSSEYTNPPWSTLLFRRLLTNENFRDEFVQRLAVHVSTTFKTERVIQAIDSLQRGIAPEVPRHTTRWEKTLSLGRRSGADRVEYWKAHVEVVREFARHRPGHLRTHVKDHFKLAGLAQLDVAVNEAERGQVLVQGVPLRPSQASLVLFKNVPIRLHAVPEPGYEFAGWEGALVAESDTVSLAIGEQSSIRAVFVPAGATRSDRQEELPAAAELLGHYPNPATGSTTITFELPEPAHVVLSLFDVLGREVALLANEVYGAGENRVVFDVRQIPSGTYFYRLQAAGTVKAGKMTINR